MIEEEQRRFPAGNGPCLLMQRDPVTLSFVPHTAAVWENPFNTLVPRAKGFICSSQLVTVAVSCPSGCSRGDPICALQPCPPGLALWGCRGAAQGDAQPGTV